MITVVNRTGAGTALVSLVVQQEGVTASTLLDLDTPADLRFVHAAPDAPSLDVIIDDAMTPSFSATSFTGFSDHLLPALAPGTHTIKVVDTPAPGTVVVIDASPVLQIGVAHSIIATGLFANLPLAGVLLQDSNRRIATEAKLRIVNASTIAGTVDVYVLAPGTAVDSETPINARVAFQTPSLYLPLAAGDYEVTLTAAADPEQVLVDATPITVAVGGIYTAVAVDSIGGIAPVQWIMMDDFATP
jgi:hypothetical protein